MRADVFVQPVQAIQAIQMVDQREHFDKGRAERTIFLDVRPLQLSVDPPQALLQPSAAGA